MLRGRTHGADRIGTVPGASPTSPIVQETSFVLILLYARDTWRESNAKIEAIRALYKEHFGERSVLRVDDHHTVRVDF